MPNEKKDAPPTEIKVKPHDEITFAAYCSEAGLKAEFARFVAHVNKYTADSTANRDAFARAVADTYKARI